MESDARTTTATMRGIPVQTWIDKMYAPLFELRKSFFFDPAPTKEQIEARAKERERKNEAVLVQWADDLAPASGLRYALMKRHAPQVSHYGNPECRGCPEDVDYGPRPWPCDEYKFARDWDQ